MEVKITSGSSNEENEKYVNWHKLASVDLSELTSSIAVETANLHDHLSYITSCDAITELDMTKIADRRTLLKMFRIAQLLLERLAKTMATSEDRCSILKRDLTTCMEKYLQNKSKLVQQISEAKKMKNNNRNLRDTVKYINSVAISKGIIQPLKCTFCSKIFREPQYLQSHIDRKHRSHQSSDKGGGKQDLDYIHIDLKDMAITMENSYNETKNANNFERENMNEANDREVTHFKNLNVTIDEGIKVPSQVPRHIYSGTSILGSQETTNVENRESSKVLEIEKKCSTMNENILGIMEKFQQQKMEWDEERVKCLNKIDELRTEKVALEIDYKRQFEILENKVKTLEKSSLEKDAIYNTNNVDLPLAKIMLDKKTEKVAAIVPSEISSTQAKIIARKLTSREYNLDDSSEEKYEEEPILSSITEVSAENEVDEASVYDVTSLSSDCKNSNKSEYKNKLQNNFETLYVSSPESKQLIVDQIRQKTSTRENCKKQSGKTLLMTSQFKSFTKREETIETPSESDPSSSDEQAIITNDERHVIGDRGQQPKNNNFNYKTYSEDTDDFETDTGEDEPDRLESEGHDDSSSQSIHLDRLLEKSPNMWKQLREATEEVVNTKLASSGINQTEKITKSDYKQAIRTLRTDRSMMKKKHSNFKELRKNIHHKVKLVMKEKYTENDKVKTATQIAKRRKSFSTFKTTGKTIRSLYKKSSMPSQRGNIVTVESPTDTVENPLPNRNMPTIEDSDSDSLPEQKHIIETVIVHNETKRSEQRNIFGTTYKESSEFTDQYPILDKHKEEEDSSIGIDNDGFSDGSSICADDEINRAGNTEIERPPTRVDNLIDNADSSVTDDENNYSNNYAYECAEYKPIKLKKATGSNILKLKESIEAQLKQRQSGSKPAGAVDTVAHAQQHSLPINDTQVHAFSASSSDQEN